MEMKLSIIIPTHNGMFTIGEMLHSIMKQKNAPEYELIVVLDNCYDCTEDEINKYRLGNLKVIKCKEMCPGGARNVGLQNASGQYIVFLDDDDRLLHDYVLHTIGKHIEGTNADVLIYGFIFGDEYVGPFGNGGHTYPNVWSKVWKKSAIGETRFNDKMVGEDLDFCNDMFKKNLDVVWFNQPTVVYTVKEDENGKGFDINSEW